VVVDTAAGCIPLSFEGHKGTRTGCGGHHRGWVAHASGSKDVVVQVWNAANGTAAGDELRGREVEVQSVLSASWSRDLSGGWDGMAGLWDAASGVTGWRAAARP
jgi:WD40 repeat protein